MKKYFLFIALSSVVFLTLPNDAFARKKYRYIKREHGVKFELKKPTLEIAGGSYNINLDLEGAYTYNWKGMVEAGPYFGVNLKYAQALLSNYNGGLIVEYNIIKNRGKRKFIPAVGIKVGVEGEGNVSQFSGGAHGALKIFVGKRTPFTVALGYRLVAPWTFQSMSHNVDLSMGFSYYFDFY